MKVRRNIAQTLNRLEKKHDELVRVKKGTYRWEEPEQEPVEVEEVWKPVPEPEESTEEMIANIGRPKELEVFEEVKRLSNGTLVLEDSKGNLYIAKQLHVPDLGEDNDSQRA